jgi:glycosyltransferase involved in cell wall biosynthesis
MKLVALLQPHYNYEGHFRHYTQAIININKKESYLCLSEKKQETLKSVPCVSARLKFLYFKFALPFLCYKNLCRKCKILHVIEFEPLSFLLNFFKLMKYKKVIITLHSCSSNYSVDNVISLLKLIHKKLALCVLLIFIIVKKNVNIVVHYKVHKKNLVSNGIHSKYITVINYPCQRLVTNPPQSPFEKVVIFGNLRSDKDPMDILDCCRPFGKNLLIAGRIDDDIFEKIKSYGFQIENSYLTKYQLIKILNQCSYVLLPYGRNYSGGAGILMDAIGSHRPVIAPNYGIFREIVGEYKTGILFNNPKNIYNKTKNQQSFQYYQYVRSSLKAASKLTFAALGRGYWKLYSI